MRLRISVGSVFFHEVRQVVLPQGQHDAHRTGGDVELPRQLAPGAQDLLQRGGRPVLDQIGQLVEERLGLGTAPAPGSRPPGVRPDLHRLIALLTLPNWNEVLRWAALLEVDLRDLMEAEVAYAERVTMKTAQRWRSDGDGPPYRNEVGIRYPIAWYWEWRSKGRQTMTAQRATRGRRRLPPATRLALRRGRRASSRI